MLGHDSLVKCVELTSKADRAYAAHVPMANNLVLVTHNVMTAQLDMLASAVGATCAKTLRDRATI